MGVSLLPWVKKRRRVVELFLLLISSQNIPLHTDVISPAKGIEENGADVTSLLRMYSGERYNAIINNKDVIISSIE
jgi:hypothetical protein